MMDYSGSKIQILDMPGIIEGAASGKGLGKRVLSAARTADLVLMILDVFQPHHFSVLKKELSEIGIKVDQKPPNVVVEKTSTGGVSVNIQVPIAISERLIKEILHIYGIHNGRIIIREPGLTDDQLIDVLSGNRIYIPSLTVLNKIDLVNQGFLKEVQSKIGNNFIPISADANINIDALKLTIYERLDLIRIYLRRKTGETDYEEPLIIRNGSNVGTVCNKIHRKMTRDFKYAQVWGRSAKFGGQKVGLDHTLLDEDVLTITKKVSAY
jgi:ribosome-interacting GTPase 1